MEKIAEICCGSLSDGLAACQGGAQRIELNSALALGGLSPSLASLQALKKQTNLQIVCMVRPRGAGFCYGRQEKEQIFLEAKAFLENGADGLAFGFLKEDGSIDTDATKRMTNLIHSYGKTAVFHRAIDVAKNYEGSIKTLIALGIDRVLTSGQKPTAILGKKTLAAMQKKYGEQIEILAGSGLNAQNIASFIKETGIVQVHSSCKSYQKDPATKSANCSFAMYEGEHEMDYDVADADKVRAFVLQVQSA
jgi:copper homeostasis protein